MEVPLEEQGEASKLRVPDPTCLAVKTRRDGGRVTWRAVGAPGILRGRMDSPLTDSLALIPELSLQLERLQGHREELRCLLQGEGWSGGFLCHFVPFLNPSLTQPVGADGCQTRVSIKLTPPW